MGTRRRDEFYAKKMQIERRKRNARALCALVVSATLANTASAQYNYIAGYEPRSDVVQHSLVDLDIKDIISSFPKWKGGSSIYNGGLVNDCTTGAEACNWNGGSSLYPTLWDSACTHTCPLSTSTTANQGKTCTLSTANACLSTYGIYKYGKGSFKANSGSKNATMRTLRGFATSLGGKGASARVAAKNNPFINKMNKYWAKQGLNELTWGQDIIEAAFKGTCVKNGNSCVKSGGVNLLDFGLVGNDFRVEVIKKGIIYLWKTKDSQKAKLFTRAWKLDFTTYTYEETKQGIEGTLSRLGAGEGIGTISCADIGDLVDSSDQLLAAGCSDPSPPSSSNNDTTLGLGIGIPLGAIAITALVFVVLLWRKSSANSKRVEELTMQLRGPGKDFYP